MKHLQKYNESDRNQILQIVAGKMDILPQIVEKDWWVVMTLKALSLTSCANFLIFKGGTSLSKGWNLIERFSEDIDLSIKREDMFAIHAINKSQKEKLRKFSRKYVIEVICKEVEHNLNEMGINGFDVIPVTTRKKLDGTEVVIDSDKDPTQFLVSYNSVLKDKIEYIPTQVKVEISCLSMHEPTAPIRISSYISQYMPNFDDDNVVTFNTVVPTRTFLEKLFLLAEEFQKVKPRSVRMSRHLYDLEKLMDTEYGRAALKDLSLYNAIVEHRRAYYALKYVNYDLHSPQTINFLIPEQVREAWKADYENMRHTFIYGRSLEFKDLLRRLEELQERVRSM